MSEYAKRMICDPRQAEDPDQVDADLKILCHAMLDGIHERHPGGKGIDHRHVMRRWDLPDGRVEISVTCRQSQARR